MLFAGVSWSAYGLTVEVLDDAGAPAAPTRHYDVVRTADLVADLLALTADGQQLKVVVDSTNGLLDGSMSVAGLEVFRADPHVLGLRPLFGSVDARQLAELARRPGKAELARLSVEDGSLRGRIGQMLEGWHLIQERMDTMAEAGNLRRHGSRNEATVALTFDDGPHPLYTGQVLDVLDRYDVRATFFCTGLSALSMPEEIGRIADGGHTVGNHTWSHPYLPDLTPAELREQVERTSDALRRVTGTRPTLMRPPYGSLAPRILDMWKAFDETLALWDVEVDDWAMPGAETITQRALSQTQPGSVILMHDAGGDRSQTVAALPALIEGLLERGLRPVTFDELHS
ncbi:polysaccharide deacetylase family protein [Kitasatospora phosalacinea]|uniref:polysaccharide deacetylase family protein n=1 Tax=Kitasatospora phosalacinea TaxID=2065 RepID=UPI00365E527F